MQALNSPCTDNSSCMMDDGVAKVQKANPNVAHTNLHHVPYASPYSMPYRPILGNHEQIWGCIAEDTIPVDDQYTPIL